MIGKFLKNNWVVTVIGGVFSVLALRLVDWLFIDSFLWDAIKNIFGSIVDFFNTDYTLKLYFLILLPILAIAVLIGVLYLRSLFKTEADGEPRFQNPDWDVYRRDVFDGIQYRWGYSLYDGSTKIVNITAYCDKCSCTLVDLVCPNCSTDYSSYMNGTPNVKQLGEVEALIIHRIENNLFERPRRI